MEKEKSFCRSHGVIEWVRSRRSEPKGLVFIPPLIGGSAFQQLARFRWLSKRGYDLFSYAYSGHGASSGKFHFSASLRDTVFMIQKAVSICGAEGLPLFGIAVCYGAIPITHGARRCREPFEKIVFVNGITDSNPMGVVQSFLAYSRRLKHAHNGVLPPLPRRFRDFFEELFPGIPKNRHFFGILNRKRTRLSRLALQYLRNRPLGETRLPETPLLCLYARRDAIIQMLGPSDDSRYMQSVRRIFPMARFKALDCDHFLSRAEARREAETAIVSFFKSG